MPGKDSQPQRVIQWRLEQLIQAGLPHSLAARAARDERYDLRELIRLVEQGYTPALAVRLIQPQAGSEGA
jgi:hypothetical protein